MILCNSKFLHVRYSTRIVLAVREQYSYEYYDGLPGVIGMTNTDNETFLTISARKDSL